MFRATTFFTWIYRARESSGSIARPNGNQTHNDEFRQGRHG
jgi:hypothetical protein